MDKSDARHADKLRFFETLRNITMTAVIIYHAVGAYSTATPHWSIHDGASIIADGIRYLFDVFMMPAFFFIAGFFAVPSLVRQGTGRFIGKKLVRIGLPWCFAVFLVIPLIQYASELKTLHETAPSPHFFYYWINYLGSIGTFRLGLWTPDRSSQMHFWFLSLLLLFFIGYALFHWIASRSRTGMMKYLPARKAHSPVPSKPRVIGWTLAATALAYFLILSRIPDISWLTVDLLLQFQPTGLVVYVASFLLGMTAFSHQWFRDDFHDRLRLILPAVLILAGAFFFFGSAVFGNPSVSSGSNAVELLVFSVVRTALCAAIMTMLIMVCRRLGNHPSGFSSRVSANSYNIYMVHIFFVVFFQHALTGWQGGPAIAKAGMVFLLTLPVSYFIAAFISRFPRAFMAGFALVFLAVLVFS
jgi:glucans biosynthesis protein C